MIQTQHRIHFRSGRRSRKELSDGVAVAKSQGRLPRATKLMALAILDGLYSSHDGFGMRLSDA